MRLIGSFCVYRLSLNSLLGARGFVWVSLGCHWAPFAPLWCCLWPHLGCLGTPLGCLWLPLCRLTVSCGTILGNPWKLILQGGPDVDFPIDICSEMVGQDFIRANRGIPGIRGIPRIPGSGVINCRSGPPFHTHRGQDDVSSKQTPSNKISLWGLALGSCESMLQPVVKAVLTA